MLKQVIEVHELLDSAVINGVGVVEYLRSRGLRDVRSETIGGAKGSTDFIKIVIPGSDGRTAGGSAPSLGIIGRLGGIGARPGRIGLVSDGDGAVAALAVALKLSDMQLGGDQLPGDVMIRTHICPQAPTRPHDPVPFMDSPVDMATMNRHEVSTEMDAILSIDTTKGNRIINRRGFAITPTVKDGYILRLSEDLLALMEMVTGQSAVTMPITIQDITPYGNGLFHVNSIMQPSVATEVPVVGLAITTQTAVPGCATGASHEVDIELVARFCVEVAKALGNQSASFYDSDEYQRLLGLYGSMSHLRSMGQVSP